MTLRDRYPDAPTAAVVVVVAGVLIAGAAVWGSDSDEVARAEQKRIETALSAVKSYDVTSADHVEGPVDYAQSPPVGGDHADQWVTCGFYRHAVAVEEAVHSMEHGAVWITYGDVGRFEIAALERLAADNEYVLVTPWSGEDPLGASVVASAWGKQLHVPFAKSGELEAFVAEYANGPQAPEQGAPCTGGSDPNDASPPEEHSDDEHGH